MKNLITFLLVLFIASFNIVNAQNNHQIFLKLCKSEIDKNNLTIPVDPKF